MKKTPEEKEMELIEKRSAKAHANTERDTIQNEQGIEEMRKRLDAASSNPQRTKARRVQ